MLYTAITRARRSAVIVGQRQVLAHALQRRVRLRSGLIHIFSGREKDDENSRTPKCILDLQQLCFFSICFSGLLATEAGSFRFGC